MTADSKEVSLAGGNLTPGVVRVGETVRRPRSASSDFIARLLKHLNNVGYKGAPRYLGSDAQGRDILSYIPGETKWRPLSGASVMTVEIDLKRAGVQVGRCRPCQLPCSYRIVWANRWKRAHRDPSSGRS